MWVKKVSENSNPQCSGSRWQREAKRSEQTAFDDTDWIGKPRVESEKRRLNESNPHVEIVAMNDNISGENATDIVKQADMAVRSRFVLTS